jgi:multiple sugar transport system ATP-binding protein
MADIVLDHVYKRYPDGTLGADDVNLEIADGEFIILVGPSGCGKSTTLNMIAGLEDISEGELRIGDNVVNDRAPKDRDIAMVFQSYALYPHMTVRRNMGFPLELAGVPEAERNRKVEEAAEVLDLTQHLDRKPANLSGGQRQRVAMGRAIVRDPAVFLMDEPLSNLDAKLRVQMRAEVSRIQQRTGTTTVYVTHDQTEAMTLGDRVAVMRAGRLQQVDTPRKLYEEPVNLFVAGFIGSPAMNFFPADLKGDRIGTPFGDVALPQRLRGKVSGGSQRVIAGVRPESFEDAGIARSQGRQGGHEFEADVELTESMGSEVYAYLRLEGEVAEAAELAEIAADTGADEVPGGSGSEIVARLAAETEVRPGQRARFWIDTDKMHLFDAENGHSLAHLGMASDGQAREAGGNGAEPPATSGTTTQTATRPDVPGAGVTDPGS